MAPSFLVLFCSAFILDETSDSRLSACRYKPTLEIPPLLALIRQLRNTSLYTSKRENLGAGQSLYAYARKIHKTSGVK